MDKKLRKPILLLLFSLCSMQGLLAQFTLSGEIRPRAEYRDGFKKPLPDGADAAFFVEQRSRLNAMFKSEKFDVYMSFQDVRNWGAVTQIYKSDPSLQNIYQAWASYKFNEKHALTLGRMELDYDNTRILGNLDWAAQGRSHDLVKYEFKGETTKLHVGAAFNQDSSTPEPTKLNSTFYNVQGNYKTMQFAWFHKDWEKATLSTLFINNGVQSPADSSVNFSQTIGVYGTKMIGGTSLEYDAYYQFGKNQTGKDLGAYMFAVNATFWKAKPNNLSIGVEYLTGDKSSTANKDEAFNPLYGTHHKFYGFMDYFYVGSGHKNKGLVDFFAKAKIKTSAKSSLLIQAHEFLSQTKIETETSEDMSSTLGTEFDFVYVLNIAPSVVLNVGYSTMFYTESLEFLKDTPDPKAASWAWVMISFKPTLFTTKTEN
ncbi:MAG TPA: alginate export family protein [Chryseolinea sp.]|nr:alginate export family protein [Chryseolinea sp.]